MDNQHVEPVQSIAPRRSGSRRRSTLAIVAPLALLIGVAAAGVLGRTGGSGGTAAVPSAAGVPADAVGSARPLPIPTGIDGRADVDFPATIVGLPVRPVADVVGELRRGRIGESVMAVSGWLTIRPAGEDCRSGRDAGGGSAIPCARETVLVASPDPLLETGAGTGVTRLRPAGPHLHPVALPGVSVQQLGGRQANGLTTSPMPAPVVIVARIDDPRLPDCRGSGRHCGEAVALERIVWVDGTTLGTHPVISASIEGEPHATADAREDRIRAAVPGAGEILSEVLVPRSALPRLNREADGRTDRAVGGDVWYVRYLQRDAASGGNPRRTVGWAVVEDASARVVAVGPSPAIPFVGRFLPDRAFGLETVDAAFAQRQARAHLPADVRLAVAGWVTLAPAPAPCPGGCRRAGLVVDVPTFDGGGAIAFQIASNATTTGSEPGSRRSNDWSVPATAIVVGRFLPNTGDACTVRHDGCEPIFTIERLAWTDGAGPAAADAEPQPLNLP